MLTPSDNFRWFALRVRTTYESPTAGLLRARGYAPFFPSYTRRRQCSDRIKVTDQPLFPGYLFCQFDVHNRLPILITPGVIGILGCGKCPVPVADSEIEALQALVSSGIPSQPWSFLDIGDRVRVNYGALLGVEGILIQFKSKYRIVLSISLLQRSVAVEIDSARVSRVHRAPLTSEVSSFASCHSYA